MFTTKLTAAFWISLLWFRTLGPPTLKYKTEQKQQLLFRIVIIRVHFDGKLFNLRGLQSKSKVQLEMLDELLYADDIALECLNGEAMQEGMNRVSQSKLMNSGTDSIRSTTPKAKTDKYN